MAYTNGNHSEQLAHLIRAFVVHTHNIPCTDQGKSARIRASDKTGY